MKERRRGVSWDEGGYGFDFSTFTSEDLEGGLLSRGERLHLFDHQRKVSLVSFLGD